MLHDLKNDTVQQHKHNLCQTFNASEGIFFWSCSSSPGQLVYLSAPVGPLTPTLLCHSAHTHCPESMCHSTQQEGREQGGGSVRRKTDWEIRYEAQKKKNKREWEKKQVYVAPFLH